MADAGRQRSAGGRLSGARRGASTRHHVRAESAAACARRSAARGRQLVRIHGRSGSVVRYRRSGAELDRAVIRGNSLLAAARRPACRPCDRGRSPQRIYRRRATGVRRDILGRRISPASSKRISARSTTPSTWTDTGSRCGAAFADWHYGWSHWRARSNQGRLLH